MILTLAMLLIALVLAYRGAGRNSWSLLIVLGLLIASQLLQTTRFDLALMGIPALTLLLALNHDRWRQRLIVKPLLAPFRHAIPEISATEQAAIDAGTVSWDGELFQPKPDWKQLFAYPAPTLSEHERAFIDGPVETLCQMVDDWKITEQQDLPPKVWRFLKRERFFGMVIPQAYGGLGFSTLAHSQVVMKLSTRSVSTAVTVMVPNSLGPAELLHRYGTEEQRRYYLPRLAKGTEIPCFALTSPVAGSDAGAIVDHGVVCYGQWKGKKTLGFRLNWDKRYITLAPVATLIGLAFKAYDPDQLLGETQDLGITCAMVPAATKGVTSGDRHRPMNAAFMNGPTQGKDVFIPMSQVIGGQAYIGQGWSMLMNCLSIGRSVSLPALSTGAGKLACITCGSYAQLREQFNTPIGKFEGVADALAPIAGLTYLMEAARTFTVTLVDQGEQPSVPSAILKYHNTESMRRVVNHAMDVHGGRAIMEGPRNYLARIYNTIPISITVEGANILTRSMMIFGQGAIRCHPYLLKEMEAVHMECPNQAAEALDRALCGHIRRNLQAAARALLLGITPRLASPCTDNRTVVRYQQQLEHASASFVLVADCALLMLGGQLKTRESISARLGDCLSTLYLGSCLLKQFRDQGFPPAQQAIFCWAMDHCLFQFQLALTGALDNFPHPLAGRLLKHWIYPLGCRLKPPSDALSHRLAAQLLDDPQLRQHLAEGAYMNNDPSDPLGRVLSAARAKTDASDALERLRQAQRDSRLPKGPVIDALVEQARRQGVIGDNEAKALQTMLMLVHQAISVDHYPPGDKPAGIARQNARYKETARNR
ncbi:acyl-CoA dehydrogenase [Motiliproteus sediminis]|uniref:acyl-CoA dehydrogenase n=1 Tax=Motiliproteus sediminis TaxID=1468178 RepID=UPI001FECFAC6|nr:acyl-CoA dehydrogenase [Motiliproteus sediminis]